MGTLKYILLLVIAVLVSGCAAQHAYRDSKELIASGKYVEGLAKAEEATKLEPSNMEYRIYWVNSRSHIVNQLLAQADAAIGQGRLTEAENHLRSILLYDPNNPMAQAGMESLAMERRHKQVIKDAEERFKKNNIKEAEEIVHTVLIENPNQREAQNLQARITAKRSEEKSPAMKLAAVFRKPITLEFRDASLRSVFDMISKVSGINFFFDKDIRPDLKANITAKSTSIEDAIRLLLVTNQLEQRILNENSILIYPNMPQKLKDYQNLTVRSFYLANAEAKEVANTLKTILKTKDIVVKEKLNLVIIRDTPEAVRLAEKLVAMEDIDEAEVMLELEVLEVQRSRLMALGIQWPDQLTLSVGALTTTTPASTTTGGTTTTTGTTTTSTSGFTLDDLRHLNSSKVNASVGSLIVNAKKQDSDSNILANPRIRVKSREKAKIMIGDRVPVITTTSTATGFASESVSYVDVGLKLEVEPTIYLDQEVAIKVNLEVSSIVKEITSHSGTLSYQIGTRNASTVLKLKDGEMQVLGGLIQNQDTRSANKIPGLGDFPMLGKLFGSDQNNSQKTEIVLAITPHMIRKVNRPILANAEFESGTESSLGSPSLSIGAAIPEAENKAPSGSATSTARPPQRAPTNQGQPAQPSAASSAPTAASTGVSADATPGTSAGLSLSWQGPAQVKVGDQFSAVLRVQSQQAITALPLLIGFDPTSLQVVNVAEGDFLKQAGGQTSFSNRIDAQAGQVFVGNIRQISGINGIGSVVTVVFKALQAAPQAKVELLSITPEPALQGEQISLPVLYGVKINN